MNLTNLNPISLSELDAEIAKAEYQQKQLAVHLAGLHALRAGVKTFIETRDELARSDNNSFADANKNPEEFEPETSALSNETSNESKPSENNSTSASEILSEINTNPSNTSATDSSSKELLKGLTLLEALKRYLAMFTEKQTVKIITDGLLAYGFDAPIKHLYESVRSTLRYHEPKGVFERDRAAWGLARENENDSPALNIEPPTEIAVKPYTQTKASNEQMTFDNKAINSGAKTNPQYCEEVLRKSGQQWLHVDQIIVCLRKEYGIIRSKEIIAAALRKNASHKRIFKALGDNRFGLLDDQILQSDSGAGIFG